MDNFALFMIMVLSYTFGVFAALLSGKGGVGRGLVALSAVVGAGAGILLAVSVVLSGIPFALVIPGILPLLGGFSLVMDPMGAFFLFLIGLGAIPSAIYGVGYTASYDKHGYTLSFMSAMFSLFLLSMSLVTMAGNVLTFLFMWEVMSLSSYFLVTTENHDQKTLQAGIWYAGMTHVGLAFLLVAFILLANGGTGDFNSIRSQSGLFSPTLRNIIFVLAFVGFGSKAGVVPLHIWLPKAHPAAPSHISSLMSGVMIKMGIYGLIRVIFDLMGGGTTWWGGMLLVFGVISAILGILYALMENDIKRLLAYSSVENIGIILIALGASLTFNSFDLEPLAMLSMIGALYHALNHTGFKGLLFLGSGSVLYATRTRNMEKLGGLIQRMPWTSFFFLIGAAAISALPPLNGFTSEWIIFQSLLSGLNIPKPDLAILMPVAMGMLALTSGLAAACFVKAFGITFLAIPRSASADEAQEAPVSMLVGMFILAFTCVVLGVAPFMVVPVLERVVASLGYISTPLPEFTYGLNLQTPAEFGMISPTLAFIGLFVIIFLIPVGLRLFRASQKWRVDEAWGCGRTGQSPRMEYTSTAFAEPLRRVFAELYQPTKELTISTHPDSKYFVESIEYKSGITPLFDRLVYDPGLRFIQRISQQIQRLQAGSLHLYLFYIAILLIILLLSARWL